MAEASEDLEFDALCTRHSLTVVERLPVPDGGSRFLAHVVDESGGHLLLKRGSGLRGWGEIPVLEAWKSTGHTPRQLRTFDPETFVCEWVEGVTLDRSDRPVPDLLRQAGEVLRELHAAPPPEGLMPIRVRATPEWVARDMSPLLSSAMLASADSAAADLRAYETAEAVLLHGDFVPPNVLVSGPRLVVIDPIGFVGPAAWDIAQLSVAVEGRDRRDNLRDVVEGYGSRPAKLDSAFAYLAFLFLGGSLKREQATPGSQAHLVAELQSLAESLC